MLPRLMDKEFDLGVSDWRHDLLPDKYLQVFFIEDVPVLWSIDLAVVANQHHTLRTNSPCDDLENYLKHCFGNVRLWVRDDPRRERTILFMTHRMLSDVAAADLDLREQTVQSLEYVAMTSSR